MQRRVHRHEQRFAKDEASANTRAIVATAGLGVNPSLMAVMRVSGSRWTTNGLRAARHLATRMQQSPVFDSLQIVVDCVRSAHIAVTIRYCPY